MAEEATGGVTIFGKIIRKEIPAKIVFENERVLAFHDVAPQAPVHVLIIPKRPIENVAAAQPADAALLGELMLAAAQVARELGIAETGYRIVTNIGVNGGQTVGHLHLHLLGGRPCRWPPG